MSTSTERAVAAAPLRRRFARHKATLLAARIVGSTALVVVLWEGIYRIWQPPSYLLPSVGMVVEATAQLWRRIVLHAWVTGYEIVLGFIVAMVVGISLAIILDFVPRLRTAIWPAILFAQIVPKIAIAPLLLIWFGFGLLPKVLLAFLIAFFPVLINTLSGFESVSDGKVELAKSMRTGRVDFFVRFKFPHALPDIFSGAKIAMTLAVVGAVVAEFVGSDRGLGYMIIQASGTLNSALMVSALLILTCIGLALYALVEVVERLAIPWHITQRRSDAARESAREL